MDTSEEDGLAYKVVVNDEGQYSTWLAHRQNPPGWTDAGKAGSKAQCLAHIKEVWTDITPLSVRRTLERSRR